ncbi:unnamed protein product [Protopolystoma xenopodis]|uniref:Uncharacterized protein n=1 Tax=Protopolystoma xenopodis TaxID=117903 RepID=A0A448XJR3_9PLAT|nr:unnamed protein product [Protopolystoma xenopodis]
MLGGPVRIFYLDAVSERLAPTRRLHRKHRLPSKPFPPVHLIAWKRIWMLGAGSKPRPFTLKASAWPPGSQGDEAASPATACFGSRHEVSSQSVAWQQTPLGQLTHEAVVARETAVPPPPRLPVTEVRLRGEQLLRNLRCGLGDKESCIGQPMQRGSEKRFNKINSCHEKKALLDNQRS